MTPDATAERIRQQAADWAVRQRMERLDAQQMDALERWLDADPAHADALADAEMLWEMAETLRANPLFSTPVPVARSTRVRRFLRGGFGTGRGDHDPQRQDIGRGVEEVVAVGHPDLLQRRPQCAGGPCTVCAMPCWGMTCRRAPNHC